MSEDKNNSEKPRLTDEQLKKNSEKLEQYDRILKVTAAALNVWHYSVHSGSSYCKQQLTGIQYKRHGVQPHLLGKGCTPFFYFNYLYNSVDFLPLFNTF